MKTCCETCGHVVPIRLITDHPDHGLVCEDCLNPQCDYESVLRWGVLAVRRTGVEVTPDELWTHLVCFRNLEVSRGRKLMDACVPRSLFRLATDRRFVDRISSAISRSYSQAADREFGVLPCAGPEVREWMRVIECGTLL